MHWRITIDFPQFGKVAPLISSNVDAKSPFTAAHSLGVAQLARHLGEGVGLSGDGLAELQVAGLMHGFQLWINLPARESVSGHPDALTFRPSLLRRLGRGLVEAFRVVAPHALVIAAGYTIVLDVMPDAGAGDWGLVVWKLASSV